MKFFVDTADTADIKSLAASGLLDGVTTETGMSDSVQRARRFLSNQIEAGGLVRYHGLPGSPAIGTLGCVITPDADDTALAWRMAPIGDLARLRQALGTN